MTSSFALYWSWSLALGVLLLSTIANALPVMIWWSRGRGKGEEKGVILAFQDTVGRIKTTYTAQGDYTAHEEDYGAPGPRESVTLSKVRNLIAPGAGDQDTIRVVIWNPPDHQAQADSDDKLNSWFKLACFCAKQDDLDSLPDDSLPDPDMLLQRYTKEVVKNWPRGSSTFENAPDVLPVIMWWRDYRGKGQGAIVSFPAQAGDIQYIDWAYDTMKDDQKDNTHERHWAPGVATLENVRRDLIAPGAQGEIRVVEWTPPDDQTRAALTTTPNRWKEIAKYLAVRDPADLENTQEMHGYTKVDDYAWQRPHPDRSHRSSRVLVPTGLLEKAHEVHDEIVKSLQLVVAEPLQQDIPEPPAALENVELDSAIPDHKRMKFAHNVPKSSAIHPFAQPESADTTATPSS